MLYFESDYTEGAHPKVLEALVKTNLEHLSGYGNDCYTESAKKKIRAEINAPEAEIEFITGGTQTNRVVISSILEPYEGVIAAVSGHVAVHEAGAIESSGHKVIALPHTDGKLSACDVRTCLEDFYNDDNHEHMVYPGAVYISHPTEYGTLYTKDELTALAKVCRDYKIPLFLDGARLGYGLMSNNTDVTLPDIASLCDVFYIGGTKVGALCGEAIVFTKNNTPKQFLTLIKQQGALIAKGRLLGVQFDTLFTDELYFRISRHAIEMAELLKKALLDKGYMLFMDSPTNQQFVIIEDEKLEELKKHVKVGFWEKPDEKHTVVRFATSWATTEDEIEELKKHL